MTSVNCRFFLSRFPVFFNLYVLLFLVTPCLVVAIQSCMEWIPIKTKNKKNITFIAKTVSKKIGAWICSMKFLSPEVAHYLYKSTLGSCKEYCCHVWVGAPRCYLELLDNLCKQICKTCWCFTWWLSWTLGSLSKSKSFL